MFKKIPDKLQILFGTIGCLFVLVSFFDVQDITKLHITRASTVAVGPLIVGVLLTGCALMLYVHEELSGAWLTRRPVLKISDGFQVALRHATIAVHFGRLEEFTPGEFNSAVVLPANEFFDDECIHDNRSALGAYMLKHFGTRIQDVRQLITDKIAALPSRPVEKEEGVMSASYGVGTCLYLERPLNTSLSIVLAAVTTKRARIGLKAETASIFAVVTCLQKLAADKRIGRLILPVLGAGHGGLRGEVALFTEILALSEAIGCEAGHHLKVIDIIIFQRNETSKPSISRASVKRILSTASAMFC